MFPFRFAMSLIASLISVVTNPFLCCVINTFSKAVTTAEREEADNFEASNLVSLNEDREKKSIKIEMKKQFNKFGVIRQINWRCFLSLHDRSTHYINPISETKRQKKERKRNDFFKTRWRWLRF